MFISCIPHVGPNRGSKVKLIEHLHKSKLIDAVPKNLHKLVDSKGVCVLAFSLDCFVNEGPSKGSSTMMHSY